MRWLRKIPPQLRDTNFCTRSACFPPSFVRQPNGPECTQIVQNTPKRQFRVQWGGSDAFVAKNSDTTSWHKLLHYIGPSCTEFRKATKRSQIVRNAPKRHFRVQWGGLGAFVVTKFRKATKRSRMHPNSTKRISLRCNGLDRMRSLRKIPTQLRGKNFCTTSARLAQSFVRQPNGHECTQIV